VNDARTIEVDDTDDMDDVEVLAFTMEVEGDSDITIDSLPITVNSVEATGNDPDDIISSLSILVDGEEVGTESLSAGDANDSTEVVVFDDLDWTIEAGETVEVIVTADFLSLADDLDAGDSVSFAFGETETDLATFDAEDESGEDIVDGDVTGSVSSGSFELRAAGLMVTFVSAEESVNTDDGADDDTGTFRIRYIVEAFGDTVYVSTSGVATTNTSTNQPATINGTAGVVYLLDESGTATTADVSSAITYSDEEGNPSDATNGVEIQEGEAAEFTLTVTRTNSGDADDNGLYRLMLKAIGWDTANDGTGWNLYDFDLEDFKTDFVSLD
jgi:hypothetical protein